MSRFKGIYWRTFTVTVGMVALTLVLLGASFFALTYSYIMSEKRGELEDKAEVIAQMAVGVYNKRDVFHLISGMRSDIEELVDVAKRMSDTEFLVWMPSMDLFISTDASVSNTEMVVPGDIVARLERGRPMPAPPIWGSTTRPALWWPSRPGPPRTACWWGPCWRLPSPTP